MEGIIGGLVALAILVAAFIVFRAAVLWYWKLDKIEEHLSAIRKALENGKGEAKGNVDGGADLWK
jgi:hypothetical protein